MYRLTARLLLVLLLVGTLAPAALAISAPPPHACCMRKVLHDHGSRSLELQAAGSRHNKCCPPGTTAHWAELGSGANAGTGLLSVNLPPDLAPVFRSNHGDTIHPVRGPPIS